MISPRFPAEEMPNASQLSRAYAVQRWIAQNPTLKFHNVNDLGIWFHKPLDDGTYTTGLVRWADLKGDES